MTLGELIEMLKKEPKKKVCRYGFGNPHSYRGYYEQLAFEPKENVTVKEMLKDAEESLGKTFYGYKGGEFTMADYSEVNLADYGCCGDALSPYAMAFILGKTEL